MSRARGGDASHYPRTKARKNRAQFAGATRSWAKLYCPIRGALSVATDKFELIAPPRIRPRFSSTVQQSYRVPRMLSLRDEPRTCLLSRRLWLVVFSHYPNVS